MAAAAGDELKGADGGAVDESEDPRRSLFTLSAANRRILPPLSSYRKRSTMVSADPFSDQATRQRAIEAANQDKCKPNFLTFYY